MSRVTCHMSRVTCHMAHFFFLTMWWSLLGEGLLSTGPTLSSFFLYNLIFIAIWVLPQIPFWSFVTIWVWVITTWVYEFCHNLCFQCPTFFFYQIIFLWKNFLCEKSSFLKKDILLNKNLYSISNKSMDGGVFFLTTEMKHIMLLNKNVIMLQTDIGLYIPGLH